MSEFTDPIVHEPSTIACSVMVGENCTVWQYATICEEAVLGEGVVVGSHAWLVVGPTLEPIPASNTARSFRTIR